MKFTRYDRFYLGFQILIMLPYAIFIKKIIIIMPWNGIQGHLLFILFVCDSFCDSVRKNLNFAHNFWIVRDRDLIWHAYSTNETLSNKVNQDIPQFIFVLIRELSLLLSSASWMTYQIDVEVESYTDVPLDESMNSFDF